ncbi:MAG: hypothetical protein WBV55_04405 [Candidatus Sulfotelmatobacter sp.]
MFAISASRSWTFKEAFERRGESSGEKWNLSYFLEASLPEEHGFEHNHPVSAFGETMVVRLATKMTAAYYCRAI